MHIYAATGARRFTLMHVTLRRNDPPSASRCRAITPVPSHGKRGMIMSKIMFLHLDGAAAVYLLSMPVVATTFYGVTVTSPDGTNTGYGGSVPVAKGDDYAGGSANKNLYTAYAQTSASDPVLTGIAWGTGSTTNTLDLSSFSVSKVTLNYALQVGGVETNYGASEVESLCQLG